MKESDLSGNEKEAFKDIVRPICKVFPGEKIVQGLLSIRDSAVSRTTANYNLSRFVILSHNKNKKYSNSKI